MGHFCWICMEDKTNEKFSGKGHRQHICKSCRKKGPEFINELKESQRRAQHYENNVKSGCIYHIDEKEFYLFTYNCKIYAAMGEQLDEVYHYIKKEQTFLFQNSTWTFLDFFGSPSNWPSTHRVPTP